MNAEREQVLCRVDDIVDGGARGLIRVAGEDRVFVIRRAGEVLAYLNSCPHDWQPLEYRRDRFLAADGKSIVCHAHGAHFDIGSGRCTRGPCLGSYLSGIPVRVEDGIVLAASALLDAARGVR
ncbi:MAG: Rieske 2Fe-2S domain-containing protein [Pseudomonadota bacterium]